MRAVIDALERLGIDYYVSGSVAASVHGVMRQSQDIDIVVAIEPRDFGALADVLRPTSAIAEPIDYGSFAMASVIDQETAEKVDLILRRPDPFERSAMERRLCADIPGLGSAWVVSVEDLVLAKLVWSGGTSELQLRDCEQLLRINVTAIDRGYLERWAASLGVADLLRQVS